MAFDAAQDLAAQAVEGLAVLGQQLGGQRTENVDPGCVGHGLGNAVALADGPVTQGVGFECCLDQSRLAHAGGAVDEQGLRLAVAAQGLEQQGDGLLFGAAAIQAFAARRDGVGAAWLEALNGLAGGPLPLAVGQVYRQGARTLIARVGLLGQRLGQHPAERLWHVAVHFAGRPWLHAGMQLAPVLSVAPCQRQFTQQQLVQDRTQGIDVTALIAAAAVRADLFRCQVRPVAERGALFANQFRQVGAKTA